MSDKHNTQESEPEPEPSGKSRRTLLKAGLAGAPLIVTLSNRSAFAKACTPSASYSVDLGTSLDHVETFCGGRSPTWWQAQSDSLYSLETTPFTSIFAGRWRFGWDGQETLRDVLWMDAMPGTASIIQTTSTTRSPKKEPHAPKKDLHGFGRAAVAAWLSATWLADYSLRPPLVVSMVNAILLHGLYSPAGMLDGWDAPRMVIFFNNTFDMA